MTKETRKQVYSKCGGRCAYCGKTIELKDMQVDHIYSKNMGGKDEFDNFNPSCRRCNYYKGAMYLETFRIYMRKLHERIREQYICKVAEDYGIIEVKEWDGEFYFEKVGGEK
jgi:5-methylcytosine-specific restriction endonuclease McrA